MQSPPYPFSIHKQEKKILPLYQQMNQQAWPHYVNHHTKLLGPDKVQKQILNQNFK